MTVSEAKLAANRLNAARSTGPRTAAGKLRASRNSLKHGLAMILLPSGRDPEVFRLARALEGPTNRDRHVRIEAVAVAEAECDLHRIKGVRISILRAFVKHLGILNKSLEHFKGPPERVLAAIMDGVAEDLMRLERYERRTRSRRKFAMRRLYAAKLAQKIDPHKEARLAAMKHEAFLIRNLNTIKNM
jgi:hypothetical protein